MRRPPTIYDLRRPRQDVLAGRIRDGDFAADPSQGGSGGAAQPAGDGGGS